MIILCIQQTTNKLEERFEGIALERLDEVTTKTTEFEWEAFQVTAGKKNKNFCGKTQKSLQG